MKLKVYTLIFSLFIFSCSSDSDDNNDLSDNNSTNAILVSKITYNDSKNPNYSYEEEFHYDGNKIKDISKTTYSNNSALSLSVTVFNYTNDLISRIDYLTDNKHTLLRLFKYDSQSRRVTEINGCDDGHCTQKCTNGGCTTPYHYNSSFSYNSDGSVVSLIEIDNNKNKEYQQTFKLDNRGNIVDVFSDDDCEVETSLVYDNKNSPFKNVVGVNFSICYQGLFSDSPKVGFYNNILSYKENSVCNNIPYKSYDVSFSYDYNQEEYPTKIVQTDSDGFKYTVLIEYNK